MRQAIPGTAMEHLLRLHGVPEKYWKGPDLPIRRAYQRRPYHCAVPVYAQHRLARIEFYTSSDFAERTALYLFDDFCTSLTIAGWPHGNARNCAFVAKTSRKPVAWTN